MKRILFIAALLMCGMVSHAQAQPTLIGVKTNLLSDGLTNLNIGGEVALASRWTFNVQGQLNPWEFSNGARWKHASIQPEFRYWFCDRFAGHFLGIYTHGGIYNIGNFGNIATIPAGLNFLGTDFSRLTDSRFQGWFAGGGIGYGYAWILGLHWNLEAEIGVGYSYTQQSKLPA